MVILQPLDIVVVDGLRHRPHHPPIMWRGLDRAVHNAIVLDRTGTIENTTFKGKPHLDRIDIYRGRHLSIHRFRGDLDVPRCLAWLARTRKEAIGYDFRQWLCGFVLGITARSIADNPHAWTCSERPYWLFTDNGYPLTARDEVLPHPRLVRYNLQFQTIFQGVWP